MKLFNFIKNFDFIRVTLAIIMICSVTTFYGVFQILIRHNRIIGNNAKNGIDFLNIVKNIEQKDYWCKNQVNIIEEQISTLYEFHRGETIKPAVKYLDE